MNTNQTQSYTLKRSSSEDSFSGKSTLFLPPKVPHVNPKTNSIEYNQDITDDAQYIKKIFDTNNYEYDHESLLEFYSDVFYIMNSTDTSDRRNVGTVLGMASLGVLGFLTFGITLIGGLAGIIFGGTIGRVIAAKVADMRRKKEIVTQEDLYIMKARCLAELGIKQKKNPALDLNQFRLCLEKVIEESSLTLETSVFPNPKLANDIRFRLRNLLMDPQCQLAFLLSYRLFKTYLQRHDIENPTNLEKAARKVYGVYMPFIRFIELAEISKNNDDPSLVAYFKIKAYISKPEIVDLIAQYPEFKTTPETLENFRVFMKQEVDVNEQMKRAMTNKGRVPSSDQIVFKKPVASSKSYRECQEQEIPDKTDKEDSVASCPSSIKNFNYEDLYEGVSAYNADLYVTRKTKYGQLPSLTNLHSSPNGMVLNLSHSNSQITNAWNNLPTIEKTNSVSIYKKPRTEQNEDIIPEVISATKQKSSPAEEPKKSPLNDKPKEYIMLEMKSPEISQYQDRSQLMSIGHIEQAGSPIAKPRRQQSNVGTPNNNNSPVHKQVSQEEKDENKLLQNSIGADVQNKVIFDKVLSIGYDNASKWDRVVNNPIIRIDKIKPEGSPVVLIRAWADITGYTPEEVFQQIYNTEQRAKWDTVTVNLRVVEYIDPTTQIIHFVIKAPIGISDRDFVQRRIFQKDYPQKGTITMGFQSFAHPNCPPVKGRVRGETHIAGYILKPSTKDPKSTEMCILTQVDIKGSIPKIIVNIAAGKAPAEWVNKLIKACEKARNEKKCDGYISIAGG